MPDSHSGGLPRRHAAPAGGVRLGLRGAGNDDPRGSLLQLGQPDARLKADRIFVYQWQVIDGWLAGGFGGAVPLGSARAYVLEFDREQCVRRAEYRQAPVGRSVGRAWMPEDVPSW